MYNNASSCVSCAGIKFGVGQDLYAFKSEGDFVTGFSGATSSKLQAGIHNAVSNAPKLSSKGYLYLFNLCGFIIFP